MAEGATKSREASSRAILNQTKDLLKVYTLNQYSQALIADFKIIFLSFHDLLFFYMYSHSTEDVVTLLLFIFLVLFIRKSFNLVLVLRTLCFPYNAMLSHTS